MTAAIEKAWPAVPPQLFTADGTSLGVVTVASSKGFKVKQQVVISASGLPDTTAKIMRFISPTQFYVGPTSPGAGQGLTQRIDISAYTVALGAFVYAQEQPKVTIKPDDIWQAIYRQEPGTTIGVELDDQWGNPYDATNTVPTNLIPLSQIPFSLGALAFPSLINSLLSGLSYDSVTSDSTIGQEILTFYNAGIAITTITLSQTADGWTLNLGSPVLDYLLLENGDYIELENDGGFILLER